MKFKFFIEGEYELDEIEARRLYGTTDPDQIAAIDIKRDPQELLMWSRATTIIIEGVK